MNLAASPVSGAVPAPAATLGINLRSEAPADWGFAEIQVFDRTLSLAEFYTVAADMSARRVQGVPCTSF